MLGRSVGNYQVVSKIGEGGMGVVYLARHLTLGRPAAIKVLLPELSSKQDIVSRFFNEARAATAIRHPGIVEVFDFGFLDEHCAYIVMEYLEGESLSTRMRRGRPTVMATLTIVRAIARALQAAHERGIVHRDLKPDNVFLVPDPELPSGERVKLLDFGVAKLASSVNDANQTRTGVVIGTPTYMAPEQCRGAGSVDHRADLYALGCVAYEMLCGQPPFVADGAGDVIAHHLYFQPRPLRAHRPDLRPEVDEFVLSLLQKDPRARPGTAQEVAQIVDRLAAAAPTLALHSEPNSAGAATVRQPAMDTTLSGAASASALRKPVLRGMPAWMTRTRVLAGAATAALVVLIILLSVRDTPERGIVVSSTRPHTGEARGSAAPVAAPAPAGEAAGNADTGTAPAKPADEARPAIGTQQSNPGMATGSSAQGEPSAAAAAAAAEPAPRGATSATKPIASDATQTEPSAATDERAKPRDKAEPDSRSTVARPPSVASDATPAGPRAAPATADKSRDKPRAGSTDTKAPPAATRRPDGCTRAAFAAVLDAKKPAEATVQSALRRLRKCQSAMDTGLFAQIQRDLIDKL